MLNLVGKIYRCWEVFARSWRATVLPAILWSASVALFIVAMYEDHTHSSTLTRSIALGGFSICNIVANVYITCADTVTDEFNSDSSIGAITYRILSVASASAHQKRLRNTACVVAESGILFTSTTIIFVIGFHFGDKTTVRYLYQGVAASTVRPFQCFQYSGWYKIIFVKSFTAACVSFHLIVIRVGENRVRSADGFADSRAMRAQQIVPARAQNRSSTDATDTP